MDLRLSEKRGPERQTDFAQERLCYVWRRRRRRRAELEGVDLFGDSDLLSPWAGTGGPSGVEGAGFPLLLLQPKSVCAGPWKCCSSLAAGGRHPSRRDALRTGSSEAPIRALHGAASFWGCLPLSLGPLLLLLLLIFVVEVGVAAAGREEEEEEEEEEDDDLRGSGCTRRGKAWGGGRLSCGLSTSGTGARLPMSSIPLSEEEKTRWPAPSALPPPPPPPPLQEFAGQSKRQRALAQNVEEDAAVPGNEVALLIVDANRVSSTEHGLGGNRKRRMGIM